METVPSLTLRAGRPADLDGEEGTPLPGLLPACHGGLHAISFTAVH